MVLPDYNNNTSRYDNAMSEKEKEGLSKNREITTGATSTTPCHMSKQLISEILSNQRE